MNTLTNLAYCTNPDSDTVTGYERTRAHRGCVSPNLSDAAQRVRDRASRIRGLRANTSLKHFRNAQRALTMIA